MKKVIIFLLILLIIPSGLSLKTEKIRKTKIWIYGEQNQTCHNTLSKYNLTVNNIHILKVTNCNDKPYKGFFRVEGTGLTSIVLCGCNEQTLRHELKHSKQYLNGDCKGWNQTCWHGKTFEEAVI